MCFRYSLACLGYEGETWEERHLSIFEDKPIKTTSMKSSRRELSIDMVNYRGIYGNNQIALFPFFTFIPKTGASFNCVRLGHSPSRKY